MMGAGSAEAIERAFSKQSAVYDQEDAHNIILRDLRNQVYDHVGRFLTPGSRILELNAGTGIDATYLARAGHTVMAIDAALWMVRQIESTIATYIPGERVSVRLLSFDRLYLLRGIKFHYVLSNF